MMKYKKYILFQYEYYYPKGGLHDITNSFNTVNEAIEFIFKEENSSHVQWDKHEIVDRDTWEIVTKR